MFDFDFLLWFLTLIFWVWVWSLNLVFDFDFWLWFLTIFDLDFCPPGPSPTLNSAPTPRREKTAKYYNRNTATHTRKPTETKLSTWLWLLTLIFESDFWVWFLSLIFDFDFWLWFFTLIFDFDFLSLSLMFEFGFWVWFLTLIFARQDPPPPPTLILTPYAYSISPCQDPPLRLIWPLRL